MRCNILKVFVTQTIPKHKRASEEVYGTHPAKGCRPSTQRGISCTFGANEQPRSVGCGDPESAFLDHYPTQSDATYPCGLLPKATETLIKRSRNPPLVFGRVTQSVRTPLAASSCRTKVRAGHTGAEAYTIPCLRWSGSSLHPCLREPSDRNRARSSRRDFR